jgi:hypothetical protein
MDGMDSDEEIPEAVGWMGKAAMSYVLEERGREEPQEREARESEMRQAAALELR